MDNNFVPTNTLATSSFDILKMDAVEDPLINVNKLATMDFEESHHYFSLAVNFIAESNKELMDSKNTLYKALSEASTDGVILESFSDFFVSVKEIIKKFLKFIKSLFQRFITELMNFVSSDTYIKKHKEDFRSFKTADNFDFTGYNYTFSNTIPMCNAALEFNADLINGLSPANGANFDVEFVKGSITAMSDTKEATLDDFRARVIDKTTPIDISDFSEELFRVYRDDELDTDTIEIDSTKVRESLNRFLDYKKTKRAVEADEKRIHKDYEEIEKRVKEITKNNGGLNIDAFIKSLPDNFGLTADKVTKATGGINMHPDLLRQVDLYIKDKCDIIQEYSNIHALAFSAKLDALKQCYAQDRAILYRALSRIQRTDSKREV